MSLTTAIVDSVSASPAVGVRVADSSNDVQFDVNTCHHLGIVVEYPEASTYSGSVLELPGFKDMIAKFPRAEIAAIDFAMVCDDKGITIAAALTGEGASVSAKTCFGFKQSFRFTSNQMNVGLEVHKRFVPGDGIAAQVKPISSTAIAPYLHFFISGTGKAVLVVHMYFKTDGPMNAVVGFQ